MLRWAFALLVCVLAGCTGQNVDEDFVAAHGALLARVDCVSTAHSRYRYQALMFLDGSVMAWGPGSDQEFFERSNAERVHAELNEFPLTTCGGTFAHMWRIEDGNFREYACKSGPPAHYEIEDELDLVTECTGFNQTLFD